MSDMNMEQKRGKKTGLLVAIIAAVAVIAVIAVLLLVDPFKWFGRKAALDKYFKVYELGKEIAEPEDMYPEDVLEFFEDNGITFVDDWSDYLEEIREVTEDVYGKDVKVTYEVTDEEEVDEDDLEEIAEMLEDRYGLDADSVQKGYQIEFEYTIEGSKDEYEVDDCVTIMLKIDGKWYVTNAWSDTTVYFLGDDPSVGMA